MMKKKMFFIFLLCSFLGISAQDTYKLVSVFNEENGLSGNRIYDITQDNNGFLWISTDNGVSRYDGKYFHTYSVENGLPSNDVLQIFKDRKGKIWANSYMKPLSYFDEKSNKFISNKENKSFYNNLWVYKYNRDGKYQTYYNKTLIEIDSFPKIYKNSNGFPIFNLKNTYLDVYQFTDNNLYLKYSINGKILEKNVPLQEKAVHSFYFLGAVFCYNEKNELCKFTIDQQWNIRKEILQLDGKISHFSFSKNYINIIGKNSEIYMVDATDFKITFKKLTHVNPNTAFIDRDQNLWIGTIDEGLYLFKKTKVRNLNFPAQVNFNFQSLHIENQDVFSGNYFGEVFKNHQKIADLKSIESSERNIRIKNIISTKYGKFLFSDHFIVKDFKTTVYLPKNLLSAIKASYKVNDSLIFLGTSNGLFRFNPQNLNIKKVGNYEGRILHFVKTGDGKILFATAEEIFQIPENSDEIKKINISKYFYDDFITGLEAVSKDLLWVSTDRGNLFLFRDLQYFKKINFKQGLSNNIKCIKAQNNNLWIGTHSDGVIKMNYHWVNKNLVFTLKYINTLQGLSANTVNAIGFKKDSVIVATEKGISLIPENYTLALIGSKPVVIQTKIDGKITNNTSHYHLEKNQQNISFVVANVDFNNHFSEIQYAVNEPKHWITLKDNMLNVQVSGGEEIIYLRTVNKNKSAVGGITKIFIEKDKYFYQQYWFWLLFGGSIIGFAVYWKSKRIIENQKEFFETELERQKLLQKERERISHDMHDDLGAGITALRFQAQFLKQKIQDESMKTEVDDLIHSTDEIQKSMREILWNLNSGNDNVGHFIEYVENYAQNFFKKSKISYHSEQYHIRPETVITTEKRRNLYLCIKEALNNACKHSKAEKVKIIFSQHNESFSVEIQDDGIGFPQEKKSGNGLYNMRCRMEDVDGVFENVASEKGVRLRFTI